MAADLRRTYGAATADMATAEFHTFEGNGPGNMYPSPRPGGGRGSR